MYGIKININEMICNSHNVILDPDTLATFIICYNYKNIHACMLQSFFTSYDNCCSYSAMI